MEKKKKRGFTLIELLAIIVILAIVAVITIPIILSVIENSKRGAAVDSAYGYKDGIDKYFVSELSENSSYNMPDGLYTVDNTNGYLNGTGDLESNDPLEVKISGNIPDAGSVVLEGNKVKSACLQFGEYKVAIIEGKVGEATPGTCAGGTTPPVEITTNPIPTSQAEECESRGITTITHTNGDVDYRFMGADPCNYIYFNCSSYNLEDQNSTNCETWRIIGAFNNKIKIVRNQLSSEQKFDNEEDMNSFAQSYIKTYLNTDYYNTLTAATKEKIANSTWNLGGWGIGNPEIAGLGFTNDPDDNYYWYKGYGMFPEGAYLAERGTYVYNENYPTTTTANVGLIYSSDYGFASSGCYSMCTATDSPTSCSDDNGDHNLKYIYVGNGYNKSECTSTNWLYTHSPYWTITPFNRTGEEFTSLIPYYTVFPMFRTLEVSSIGSLSFGSTEYTSGVRPTVYLNSGTEIEGEGTSTSPYKIKQ